MEMESLEKSSVLDQSSEQDEQQKPVMINGGMHVMNAGEGKESQ